ncbi:hypothetical protein BpHYR1_015307 [Brachionus plicatilis]|uniref:Uncharacterized protein n=1 Tax=Brachionus plicatilis TaxID=10195 RepID=A0A3M7RYY7_BRAPC|nr:hypothetical protein BpHYR1_015307 [Brachionus plicatilis]
MVNQAVAVICLGNFFVICLEKCENYQKFGEKSWEHLELSSSLLPNLLRSLIDLRCRLGYSLIGFIEFFSKFVYTHRQASIQHRLDN